jgi:anti-sigma regulatory factor (Ser/Thr protein kinase)
LLSVRVVVVPRVPDSVSVDTQPAAYDVELRLPQDDSGAGMARELVRETVPAPESWREDVVLVVSELVTNALLHGTGTPVLRLIGTASRVRIEVLDHSPVLPAVRESGPDGGWGLPLVEQLTTGWGAYLHKGGKVVWCEMTA